MTKDMNWIHTYETYDGFTIASICNKAVKNETGSVEEYASDEEAADAFVILVREENPIVTGEASRDALRAAGITTWKTINDLP